MTPFYKFYTLEEVLNGFNTAKENNQYISVPFEEFLNLTDLESKRFSPALGFRTDMFCEEHNLLGLNFANENLEKILVQTMIDYCDVCKSFKGDVEKHFAFFPLFTRLDKYTEKERSSIAKTCGGTKDDYLNTSVGVMNIFLVLNEPFNESNMIKIIPILEQSVIKFEDNDAATVAAVIHSFK